ncbi:NAD(P)/FAD-dependent oxidoreductase [Ornithinimicrobium sp. Arc0846-15]|nr:NAD(P)/FAD-dependent oxidoreductase [Ornithinimicrobium laminariae]
MSHADHTTIERHCDVAIIGGSAAGLAAALQLSRQRRSVIVIDGGEPRNTPAEHMHSFLGYEGQAPGDLLAVGRDEVRNYGGEILTGQVETVTKTDGGKFVVHLPGGNSVVARRVIAATGLRDHLPDIPGMREQWGHGVIHCPFCHGYEARDQDIVALITSPMGLHAATLFTALTDKLTLVLHAEVSADEPGLDRLRAAGVAVLDAKMTSVNSAAGGALNSVDLDNGQQLPARTVVIGPKVSANIAPFVDLGLQASEHPSGMGTYIPVEMTGETPISGLFAAGSLTNPGFQVMPSAAHGSQIGAYVSFTLVDEDIEQASKVSGNAADWDSRYSSQARVWSGNPNGSIVVEAEALTPGTALEVGAGEGADSIWLAERGWSVTTNDISQVSLDRAMAEANRRGLTLIPLQADINDADPIGGRTFDLVSLAYASFPKTPDSRGQTNVLNAVKVGGTVLLVGHDLAPMLAESLDEPRPFDHLADVQPTEFAEVLEASDNWEVLVNELRPRPSGHIHSETNHHVNDVIVRARRVR